MLSDRTEIIVYPRVFSDGNLCPRVTSLNIGVCGKEERGRENANFYVLGEIEGPTSHQL
jgi:hypothetical protein